MEVSEEKLQEYSKRLLLARMRLLCTHGFYGLLLMHVGFGLTDQVKCGGCGGDKIAFNPAFLDQISDGELDYALMHEILHIVLRHEARQGELEPERYNIACDIVVNSNILKSNGMDEKSITLHCNGGVQPHTAPDGREGYLFTAEELFALVPPPNGSPIKGPGSKAQGKHGGKKEKPAKHDDNSENSENSGGEDNKPSGEDSKPVEDNDASGNGDSSGGWMKGRAKKEIMHAGNPQGWDDHGHAGEIEPDDTLRDVWVKRFQDACEAISIRDPSNSRGLLPAFAQRMLEELRKPQTDWRTILTEFIQEEITDYSFTPPDRRFADGPFYLPDFNEKDDKVEDVLFMIDTSASMSDDMITAAYSEIKGAIDQFNGKLQGWLGFFDAAVIEPQPFADEDEFRLIRPSGGGGTDFQIIFEYVAAHMTEKPPVSIIILTDGYAPFPKERLANGIPVLWLLNNEDVTPPWGKIARIKVQK